jgi:hypothetical protein
MCCVTNFALKKMARKDQNLGGGKPQDFYNREKIQKLGRKIWWTQCDEEYM